MGMTADEIREYKREWVKNRLLKDPLYFINRNEIQREKDRLARKIGNKMGLRREAYSIIGNKYGRLTVVEEVEKEYGHRRWLCKCDCGGEKITYGNALKSGKTQSCGCLHSEFIEKLKDKVIENILGKVFGRLTVLSQAEQKNGNNSRWVCICECGNNTISDGFSLFHGLTKSCGCLGRENVIKANITHRDIHSKEYSTWAGMKNRCYNINEPKHKDYGARGIIVCERWVNSYENFLEDMGRCPSPELSLDRINTNGNYEKDNCRWASNLIQANNKTNNHYITYDGVTKSLADWARNLNIKYDALKYLISQKKLTLGEIINRNKVA